MERLADYVYELVISHYYVDDITIAGDERLFIVDWNYKHINYYVEVEKQMYDNYYIIYNIPGSLIERNVNRQFVYKVLFDNLTRYAQIKPRINF